jgi:hypothetical protein
MLQKIRFISSLTLIYVLTIGTAGYLLLPGQLFSTPAHAEMPKRQIPKQPVKPRFVLVSGIPVKIVIPASGIDLSVDPGYYNPADGSWTLSQSHAQYAMMTTLANNSSGNTFIYGHGTDAVFGKIGTQTPTVGAQALIYTDNGHILSYRFHDARNLAPTDTSVFDEYNGPAILTIQTCTGSLSEWRTMFRFDFEKVIQ